MQPKAHCPSRIGSARKANADDAGTSICVVTQCDRPEEGIACSSTTYLGEKGFHRIYVEDLVHLQRAIVDAPDQRRAGYVAVGVKFERPRRAIIKDRLSSLDQGDGLAELIRPG